MKRVAVVALGALCLTACATTSPHGPSVAPSESSSLAVISQGDIASSYRNYLATYDAVTADGGKDSSRLASVASGPALVAARKSANEFASEGVHTVGSTSVNNIEIQDSAETVAQAYVCEDQSKLDALNSDGESIADPGRFKYFEYSVEFVRGAGGEILVNSIEAWTGGGICRA